MAMNGFAGTTNEAVILDAAIDDLAALRERAAALESRLGALVSDRWAGWHYDGDMEEYACFYCAARGEEQGAGAPPHRDNCPLVAARHLLAAPRAAGARAGESDISPITGGKDAGKE